MVIASIDLKNGHVVQLKNGKELVLQRDDADALISQFDMYGEVAVIDLDAALGNVDAKGNTVNTPLLKSLLHHGNVRTGGGIRTVKRARELISLGAEKVIIGSSAWKANPQPGESVLNEDFLNELAAAIGKDRIIISVDAINGKIAVKGWTETVDIPLIEGAKQAEKFHRPVICLVDTAGAFCGVDAEKRGQGEAIARNLMEFMTLKTPIISIVLGEGGSGGALALAVCDELAMLENALYSVISPRGFASILWKDAAREREACDLMKITAKDLTRLGVCDYIIPEAQGGAHNDAQTTANNISSYISKALERKMKKGLDELINERYNKFRIVGEFEEPSLSDKK